MLGLGVGFYKLAGNEYPISGFAPDQIENLALWLRFNTDITGSDGEVGVSSQTTPYPDGSVINLWLDQSGNGNHARQTNTTFMPLFEADEPGALNFANNAKYMDLSGNIQVDANTDFTVIVRFKCVDFGAVRALIGSADDEFFRLNNNRTFRLKIGGTNTTFQESAGVTMATDTYYTAMVVRSNGSTGDINVYVRGGVYTTASGKDWNRSSASGVNPGQIDFNNIGADSDDSDEFKGFIKDVIVYDGTAVTAAQRELLFDYIESQ